MAALAVFAVLLASLELALGAAPPYGQLRVQGSKLLGSNGQQVALHGMSLYWSSFTEGPPFFTAQVVADLKTNWNANLIRIPLGVNPANANFQYGQSQIQLVMTVIDAAIQNGIYCIVDWHDHDAPSHLSMALDFFKQIAQKYGSQPNILYETFNEPLQVDWATVVKPYHEKVVAAIRQFDKNNVIILGTPVWSQRVDTAAANPVQGSNLCYTLHYYAASHKQDLRDKAQQALNMNTCIFVTEYGTVDASGYGSVDAASSREWWAFLDQNKISYANWAMTNINAASSAVKPGTPPSQITSDSVLTESGRLVKAQLKAQKNF